MEEKYIMVSLEDEKTKRIAEVLSNKTCKKILDYLIENKNSTQNDISKNLNIPLNTLDYNIKKLLESGLIKKGSNFFWSKKGKKIAVYSISNKSIIISPEKNGIEKLKSILPIVLIVSASTFALGVFEKIFNSREMVLSQRVYENADVALGIKGAELVSSPITYSPHPIWIYFLAGALFVLFLYSIINWRKL